MIDTIPIPDRFQRVILGLALMMLTVLGLVDFPDWMK